jgi:acetylglutamate kinase
MNATLSPEAHVGVLIEALPYIQKFRGQTFVIKYGGAAMEDEAQVGRLLRDIVFLEAVGINPVLVHGGGKAITANMRAAGLEAQFVNGLRVTGEAAIGIVTHTLDAQVNPRIVSTIEQFGGRAVGVSGRRVFVARRLPPQPGPDGTPVDTGFVGEAVQMTTDDVHDAIHREVVPVISPVGADQTGTPLNINADLAAAALAASIHATKLIYISDVPGILRDPSDPGSLIPGVPVAQVASLIKDGVIAGGMIPKVRSAASALEAGVEKIHMIAGHTRHALLLEIFTNQGIGTEITL